jgi:hypothetical protein
MEEREDKFSEIIENTYLCYMSILVVLHSSALIWIFFGRYRKCEIDMNTRTLLLIYEAIYLMNLTYAIISVVNNLRLL